MPFPVWQSLKFLKCCEWKWIETLYLLGWGRPLMDKWKLHPSMVRQIWTQFETVKMDLFATHLSRCLHLLSLVPKNAKNSASGWTRWLPYGSTPCFSSQWADCPAESLLCSQGLKRLIQVKSNLAQYFLPGRQYCISCVLSYAEHTHHIRHTKQFFSLFCGWSDWGKALSKKCLARWLREY